MGNHRGISWNLCIFQFFQHLWQVNFLGDNVRPPDDYLADGSCTSGQVLTLISLALISLWCRPWFSPQRVEMRGEPSTSSAHMWTQHLKGASPIGEQMNYQSVCPHWKVNEPGMDVWCMILKLDTTWIYCMVAQKIAWQWHQHQSVSIYLYKHV